MSPDGFVQHDPAVGDGLAGLRAQAASSAGGVEIVRLLEDGPFVVAHGQTETGSEAHVFFAVFRFENGRLVEHWRFTTTAVPPNQSGHTQTDGPAKPDGRQDADVGKAVVREYCETKHTGGKHDQIRCLHVG